MKSTTILFLFLSSSILFTNCKKKSNDPTPTTTATTTTTTNTNPTNGTFSSSGSISVSGVSYTISPLGYYENTTSGLYSIIGYGNASNSNTIAIGYEFKTAKPTTSSVENINSSRLLNIFYTSGSDSFIATSGTATVTVNGPTLSISFTNVTFKNMSTTAPLTISGQVTVTN